MQIPPIVSPEEWQTAHEALVAKEKAALRASDALAAERRRGPVTEFSKPYVFAGPDGPRTLTELFDGRAQLIVYHFMAHLHARNTSFVLISRGPLDALERYRARMGWDVPWYSSADSDFNADLGLSTDAGEMFGLSVFIRDGERVFRSHFVEHRGVETLGTVWSLLDITPLGRQEAWEDSPPGRPQTPPYTWWRRHDEYPEVAR